MLLSAMPSKLRMMGKLADMLEKGDLQLKSNAQLIQEWVEYRDLNG